MRPHTIRRRLPVVLPALLAFVALLALPSVHRRHPAASGHPSSPSTSLSVATGLGSPVDAICPVCFGAAQARSVLAAASGRPPFAEPPDATQPHVTHLGSLRPAPWREAFHPRAPPLG